MKQNKKEKESNIPTNEPAQVLNAENVRLNINIVEN